PPEQDATLTAFYRRVRPHARGWRAVARKSQLSRLNSQHVESSDLRLETFESSSLASELLNAVLGCVLVYAALFGVGQILLRSAAIGAGLLAVAAAAGLAIARSLSAESVQNSSASLDDSTS